MTNSFSVSRRTICIILFLLFGFGVFVWTANPSFAVEKQTPTAAANTEFLSSNDAGDFVQAAIVKEENGDWDTISITCKHSQAFEYLDIRLIPYAGGDAVAVDKIKEGKELAANGTWEYSFQPVELDITGQYWIFIYKYDSREKTNDSGYLPLMRGPLIEINDDGSVTLMEYADIMENNAAVSETVTGTAKFKKKDMSDYLTLLFKKKQSNSLRTISSAKEQAYYEKVSNKIVSDAGADTDYEKAKAIYAWIARNFYYDKKHGSSGQNKAYDDPYENLRYQQNGTGNSYNAYNGKVALQCDGYAGVYCALIRAQGIPCRIIAGRHTEPSSSKNWSNYTGVSHCWTEMYIDGDWIIADPCSSSYSKYSKGDGESAYSFKKSPQVIYEYFDMTEQALANSHYSIDIKGVWLTVKKVDKPSVKKKSSTKVKVTWKKVKNATNYQVQYSKKKASGYKTIATTGNVSSKVVFGSKSRTCYYRVRGYTFQNGIRINGAWSKPAAFKIK